MKEIFRNADSALVGLYQSILDAEDIPSFIHNLETQQSLLSGIIPAICPLPIFFPTLSVLNDEDYDTAMAIITTIKTNTSAQDLNWKCINCQEAVPTNFTTCWNCQAPKPATSNIPPIKHGI